MPDPTPEQIARVKTRRYTVEEFEREFGIPRTKFSRPAAAQPASKPTNLPEEQGHSDQH